MGFIYDNMEIIFTIFLIIIGGVIIGASCYYIIKNGDKK